MSKEGWEFQHGTLQRIGKMDRSSNRRHEKIWISSDLKRKEERKATADWCKWFLWKKNLVDSISYDCLENRTLTTKNSMNFHI